VSVQKYRPLSACGCKKFALDALGDHVSTCTVHSGAKEDHDWAVEQLADLFRTTHRVKTQQVARSRGQRCGDIELAVSTSRMRRVRCLWCWISALPTNASEVVLNINDNRPSNAIASTSGRLHSEFVLLLFLQAHRPFYFYRLM
jgi:hypothetical protein